MNTISDLEFVRSSIECYTQTYHRFDVASIDGGVGVPEAMFDGKVNAEGWVSWKWIASTLSEQDIADLEQEFSLSLPPMFRAYLLAGFQLLEQVHSPKHDQLIFNVALPADRPLKPLRDLLLAWNPLRSAGFIPMAQWGDGFGPMCFDTERRSADGDCPVVWMDHDALTQLSVEQCRQRDEVMPYVKPAYDSYREFFEDVFVQTQQA